MQEALKATSENSQSLMDSKNNAPSIRIKELDFLYGNNQVIHDVSLDIFSKEVMAFIGP